MPASRTAQAPSEHSSQNNLKRNITTFQAVVIAFNQIVGGGIVSLTGLAIALTGGGVSVAFFLAAAAIMVVSLPYAAIGSAMPVTGGAYTYSSQFIHPIVGYAGMCIMILGLTSLGLYGTAAGQYLHRLNPWFNETYVGVALISFFYMANLLGAAVGARLGIVMTILMLAGFGTFVTFGMPQVDWLHYPPIMPRGWSGLLQAAALLTFAIGGGAVVVEIGGEMKNPGRSIPLGLLGGTLLATLMYVAIGVVAAGVLPVEQVANQPLSVVAQQFLSPTRWTFFILGGAITALVSTMNTQLLAGSKSMLAAVDDGWFPGVVGAVNKRHGTPHFLLTFLYCLGLAPVVFGVPIDVLASAVAGLGQLTFGLVIVAALRMRYVRPDLHDSAPFKLRLDLQWGLSLVGVAVCLYQSYLLFANGLSKPMVMALVGALTAFAAWGAIRYPQVRRGLASRSRRP
jgi:basic amino acid/polyamine antiporter, APA family